MKHSLFAAAVLSLALVACVDKTGLSADTTRTQHPQTGGNAAVIVWEFADLQCPACRAAHAALLKPLVEKYGTQIRYDYRHFPLRSIHRYALEAAEGAECAADQGKFWDFLDLNYTNQDKLNSDTIREWAEQLNLDMPLFERCMKSHIKRDVILADYAEGQKLGVAGTPTFLVNGVRVESDLTAISAAIDAAAAQLRQRL